MGWNAIEQDQFRTAEEIARHALRDDPVDLEALQLLGDSLFYRDRFRDAIAPLQAVFERARVRGVGHRLGYCHLALGDFANAEAVLQCEVRDFPDQVNAFNALGIALVSQGRRAEALALFLRAAELDPQSMEAHNNIGNVLTELHRYAEAVPHLRRVIARNPALAEAHHNLGLALYHLQRYDEAAASFERALGASPSMTYTLGNLIRSETAICRWRDLEGHLRLLRERLGDRSTVEEPFVAVTVLQSPQEQLLCAEAYARDKYAQQSAPPSPGARVRSNSRLRLAYLSADFRQHPTAFLIAGLLERHDRSKFDVFGLSFGADDQGEMRQRVMRGLDRFLDVRDHDDAQVARLMRDLEIDIAIDLMAYTAHARPGILANRPAPVQVAYLGFPGTTGAGFIDYLVADRFVVPEQDQCWYSEKIVYLPDCYQVNDDRRRIAERTPARAAVGLPAQGFVFCCFNDNYKIQPQMFDIWMRLLGKIPDSVLWLLESNPWARQNLESEAKARGVDPHRLIFAPRLAPEEHLARQRLADLFLDTLPCNAHTTASDALWSGLPVLTCSGNTFAGRVAGSLLQAVGLPELITYTHQDYETLATRLASDATLLGGLREKLARNRSTHSLFDTDRFRRHIELAYLTMWEIRQTGNPPRAIVVEPVN